uniref:Membrane-bound transcription factor site-2 protease n=1 Tax=Angiostrongylus cantonensis TaxID=6313 RepID=A0A0K0CZZ2_ANGCA
LNTVRYNELEHSEIGSFVRYDMLNTFRRPFSVESLALSSAQCRPRVLVEAAQTRVPHPVPADMFFRRFIPFNLGVFLATCFLHLFPELVENVGKLDEVLCSFSWNVVFSLFESI